MAGNWTADLTRITADGKDQIIPSVLGLQWTADGGYITRVVAVVFGIYAGIECQPGDTFDIYAPSHFSDSTVSEVPPGNPAYPFYGWMAPSPSQSAAPTLYNSVRAGLTALTKPRTIV